MTRSRPVQNTSTSQKKIVSVFEIYRKSTFGSFLRSNGRKLDAKLNLFGGTYGARMKTQPVR